MSQKKEIIKDVGSYSAATFLAQLITAAGAILTRKMLGPTQSGVWSALQVVLIYASYSALGTTFSTLRQIPFYHGKKDFVKAENIKDSVISFALASSVITSLGIILFAYFFRRNHGAREVYFGLFFIAGLVILERLNNLLIALLRAYRHFSLASKQLVLSAIVNVFFIGVLSYQFKIYGFIMAMAASFAFNIGYILQHTHLTFRPRFSGAEIKELIAYGFPLMILASIGSFLLTIDRLMIAKFLGFEALGFYGVAILATNYIYTFPNSVAIIFIPAFQEKFGRNERAEDLRGYLSKSTLGFSNIMPLVVGCAWFLGPLAVTLLLPKFTPGIDAMKALILSSYFVALVHPYEHFLIATKKQWYLIPITLAACLLAVTLNYLAIKSGWGITGVAIATSAIFFAKFTAIYFLAARFVFEPLSSLRIYFEVLLKFLLTLSAILVLQWMTSGMNSQIGQAILACCLFSLLCIPFLQRLNAEFELWPLLKGKLSKIFKPKWSPVSS